MNTRITSIGLASLVCAMAGSAVPTGVLARDTPVLNWLRDRAEDRWEARSRVGEWLEDRYEDRSDARDDLRDWLRDRHRAAERERSPDWWDWPRHPRDHGDPHWRPFLHWYDRHRYGADDYPWRHPPGYRYDYRRPYYYDDRDRDDYGDIWPWVAFAAIAWKLLDNLNEDQQRQHEMALGRAARVPVGETVRWHSGSAEGAVTPVRERAAGPGAYCREFRQEVMIGDRKEIAYGRACRMPDGTWRVEP